MAASTESVSASVRSASTREASRNCGSLSMRSACSGVAVSLRRARQTSRFAASRISIAGGGEVRFQYV